MKIPCLQLDIRKYGSRMDETLIKVMTLERQRCEWEKQNTSILFYGRKLLLHYEESYFYMMKIDF